jgi:plasmid stabilization system protein ParE
MTYCVEFTDSAGEDAEAAYAWIRKQSPSAAVRWFNGLANLVESLETYPKRSSVAPESDEAPEQIRQVLYGKRPHVYRVLFIIRKRVVYVIHIRHGARQPLTRDELQLP